MFDFPDFFAIIFPMETIKNKKMTSDQLLKKRKEIIDLYNKQIKVMKIVEETGVSWPAVNAAIKLYKAGGLEALRPKMGRTHGSGRQLSVAQEDEIKNILYTEQPRQVGIVWLKRKYTTVGNQDELMAKISYQLLNNLPVDEQWEEYRNYAKSDTPQYLWCRDSVKVLIKLKCDIELSLQGVDKYLVRWGFPKRKRKQRPITKCSYEIQMWLSDNFQTDTRSETYWLDRERLATKNKQSMISATDKYRRVFWTVVQGNFTQDKQIEFLQYLVKQSRRPCNLIRNNYKHYTNQLVQDWLSENNIMLYPPLLPEELLKKENDKIRDKNTSDEIKQERLIKREQQAKKDALDRSFLENPLLFDYDKFLFDDDLFLFNSDQGPSAKNQTLTDYKQFLSDSEPFPSDSEPFLFDDDPFLFDDDPFLFDDDLYDLF